MLRIAPRTPEFLFDLEGMLNPKEINLIYQISAFNAPKEGYVVNLGVLNGKSVATFCAAVGSDRVIGIDNWTHPECSKTKALEQNNKHGFYPKLIDGDSRYPPDWLKDVAILFVDTKHNKYHVRDEMTAWFPRLRSDAVVMFHDYGDILYKWFDGDPDALAMFLEYNRAIDELMVNWRVIGHKQAMIAFKL